MSWGLMVRDHWSLPFDLQELFILVFADLLVPFYYATSGYVSVQHIRAASKVETHCSVSLP